MPIRIGGRELAQLAGVMTAGLVGLANVAAALPPPREWDLGVGAYGWLTAAELQVDGTNRFTGDDFTRHFHKDLSDAFKDADGGFGGYIDARFRRFVGIGEGTWVQSDYNGHGYQTSTIGDIKLGFRVLDVDRPFSSASGPEAPHLRLDLLAGARYFESDADVDDSQGQALSYDQSRDWFNPVVGIRWNVDLIPNLTFGAIADVGGFDIGNASHVTWSLNPRLNYSIMDHFDVFVGWKRLVDHHDGDRDWTLNGPQVGIGYSF